jgi:hypothetical protein
MINRRNRYDKVIFRICSDDRPPTVFEGAIHIIWEGKNARQEKNLSNRWSRFFGQSSV